MFYHIDKDVIATNSDLQMVHVEYVSQSFQNELESSGASLSLDDEPSSSPNSTKASESESESKNEGGLRFCAFAEDSKGYLFAIDTTTQVVVLIDPTHHRGPWIVSQSFDEFCEHLDERKTGENGQDDDIQFDEDVEEEEEDIAEYDENMYHGANDDDENEYCCNICMEAIEEVRYHCETCADFDSCEACYNAKKTTGTHTADHPMVATMN
jgi:predicted transcriptional regulator